MTLKNKSVSGRAPDEIILRHHPTAIFLAFSIIFLFFIAQFRIHSSSIESGFR